MTKEIETKPVLISDYLQLEKDEKFVIPEYQRDYSWKAKKEQCEKLLQDINVYIKSNADEPYFLVR